MRTFLLIVAALVLPFGAIGSFTYGTYLSMRDGAAAGSMPAWLFAAGIAMVIGVGVCIYRLNRIYANRGEDAGASR